mmetsp:Transcript_70219/g.123827  ORF Transcript_70219/g.123827 Transcript_70219/m.123827 type:complete len:84 (-) Transcript_70219:24-275(-)
MTTNDQVFGDLKGALDRADIPSRRIRLGWISSLGKLTSSPGSGSRGLPTLLVDITFSFKKSIKEMKFFKSELLPFNGAQRGWT